jgi:hypothetical protein
LKHLYGVPESGLHWFITFSDHHRDRLGMLPSKGDKCLLRKKECDGISLADLQVDDSFEHGTANFLDEEEKQSHRFKC